MTEAVLGGSTSARGYWRSVTTLASGTIGAQAIGVCAMLITARLYAPADFGRYAFFFIVSGALATLGTAKYEQAVFLARDRQEAAEIAALALVLASALALVTLVLSSSLGSLAAAAWPQHPLPLEGAPIWLALAAASGGWISGLTALAVQQKAYRAISHSRLLQSATAAGTAIGLGLAGASGSGLVVGFVAGQLAGALRLALELKAARSVTPGRLLGHARRHHRFASFTLGGDLLNYLGQNLVAATMPAQFGAAALGHYNVAQRLAASPIAVLGGAMGEVFRSGISAQAARPGELPALFRAAAQRLVLVGLALVAPLLIAGPLLFESLLGPGWSDAGRYVQILSPLILARFVALPLGVVLLVRGRQRLDAVLQVGFVAAAGLALWIGSRTGEVSVMLICLVAVQTALYGIQIAAAWRACRDAAGS